MNTIWWEIDINGCYSLVNIAFAPICTCKNNQWIWCHSARSTMLSQKRPSLACLVTLAKWVIDDCFSRIVCSEHKMACKEQDNALLLWIMIFWSLVMQFANDFQEWSHEWDSLAHHPTCNQKIVLHGKICFILYISTIWLTILVKCHLFIKLGSWSSLYLQIA